MPLHIVVVDNLQQWAARIIERIKEKSRPYAQLEWDFGVPIVHEDAAQAAELAVQRLRKLQQVFLVVLDSHWEKVIKGREERNPFYGLEVVYERLISYWKAEIGAASRPWRHIFLRTRMLEEDNVRPEIPEEIKRLCGPTIYRIPEDHTFPATAQRNDPYLDNLAASAIAFGLSYQKLLEDGNAGLFHCPCL